MASIYTACRIQRKFETCLLKVKIHHVYFSLACKHICYGNVSRKIVGEFISCCSTCSLKSIRTKKSPLQPIISTGFMEKLQVMYNLRFGDYQYYLQRSKLSIQIDTIQIVCDFVNTESQ